MLSQGSTFPLKDQDVETNLKDFDGALSYGNHKSAKRDHKTLLGHLNKELSKGWIIPLLPSDARKIPNALISPLGVVTQSTINEHGEIIPSSRVTHDLSFPGKFSQSSVNSRTDFEQLEPCRYGHMLLRTIHQIVALRLKHPSDPIVMQKIDFKSAYRRQHLNAKTAVQCMSTIEIEGVVLVLLNLRLSFGGSACPSEWCVISETLTDLANKILNHKDWDPTTIFPSLINKVPKTVILGDDIQYAKARPLLVNVPTEEVGMSDVYIDDICTVGVLGDGDKEREMKLKSSVLLAMDIMGRPCSELEPLPRDPLPSIDKLLSEAGLSETKCLLGWVLDTRHLRVRLHSEKYEQWTKQIKEILEPEGALISKKVLEVTLGRLNHAASILPMTRHFLSRLSYVVSKANYFKPINLKSQIKEDLKLWIDILDKLKSGISMNLLTFRPPDIIIWTDACEYGIGGYSHPRGRAWTWPIPEELKDRAHINILEFMAAFVGIWVEILEGLAPPESCILAFGDNTSAIGWLHKSKYRLEGENDHSVTAKLTVARKLASVIIDHEIRLFSQWFPGEHNEVAAFLSRHPHDRNDDLTLSITSSFSSQVPKGFKVSPLPREIESFIYNVLLKLPKTQPQHQDINSSDQVYGGSGRTSCPQLGSTTISSLNRWNLQQAGQESSVSLRRASEKDLPKEVKDWLQAQSEIPSACWHRPSWRMAFQTQGSPQTTRYQ
jgi:hypothetical protein